MCGRAMFSAALCGGLTANGADVGIVRIADGQAATDSRVVGELVNGSTASVAASADLLSQYDVAVIQHDFDIYGGTDGDEVLAVMRALSVPSIVVAHTIPLDPTPHQRSVLEAVTALADRVVVMSEAASARLLEGYAVDRQKVSTITHGAIPMGASSKRGGRPTILTWGFLGPGKGVERVIDAMGSLHELRGRPQYVVAGRTHPRVLAAEGESYREARIEQARANGLATSVTFDGNYRSAAALSSLIQSCAVIVLPYDSTDQVTSGVLVSAVASGRPVVATAFPHAIELLGTGAGIIVDHDDPDAMATALRRVLCDPRLAGSMAAEGRRLAPTLAWTSIADSYVTLAQRLVRERRAFV
ncbi:glycosyltransferase [Mycobacterium sp. URHB0044]|uniref:glycosyltransferase n=1 Tax=Mycobacterium sp. URHB0044 TaxID=1380386 RepID=UPI0006858F67|nr:glycosyltransferase [Mycobacterium sp. URHB0044]